MNRPAISMIQRLSLLFLFGSMMTLQIASPLHAAEPVCMYQSRSYSEGAFICVEKSLMQACTSDGTRLLWKIVADKDIGERCLAPISPTESRKRIVHRTRMARQIVTPTQFNSAKCFVFNGKRYCE